jgi:parvulin-like peptidyl-prolyl isomerase
VVLFSDPRAEALTVDRIAAVVDDHIIFASEVQERAVPDLRVLQDKDPLARARAEAKVLHDTCEALIDEMLIEREAERVHITETDAETAAALEVVAKDHAVTVPQLIELARDQGYTERTYRAVARAHLLQGKVFLFRQLDVTKPEEGLAKLHQMLRSRAYIDLRLGGP